MKVLLIGNGGRENAMAWKICQSTLLTQLYVAPGNAGTAQIAKNINIDSDDLDSIINFALEKKIDLVAIGPEVPLAKGLSDKCKENGIRCFGPSKFASQLESSKQFAKSIMSACGIPSARSVSATSVKEAVHALDLFSMPTVIKADGLAAGKGVFICTSKKEAQNAITDILDKKIFGDSGSTVIIEEFLEGPEISVFAFTDGTSISSLIGACDYKRIGDGDTGPNTGGMGAYSPAPFWNKSFEKIGFKNAIVAKQMPDDADWDPADARYSTVRWMIQPGSGIAVGPSRANPITGEIYDADVRVSSDWIRHYYNEYTIQVSPLLDNPNSTMHDSLFHKSDHSEEPPVQNDLFDQLTLQQKSSQDPDAIVFGFPLNFN